MLPITHINIFRVVKIKCHFVQCNIYKGFPLYNHMDHIHTKDYYTLDYYNLFLPFVSPFSPNLVFYIFDNDSIYRLQFLPLAHDHRVVFDNFLLGDGRNAIHDRNFCNRSYPIHQPSFFLIFILSVLNNQVKKSFGNFFCISIPFSWNN